MIKIKGLTKSYKSQKVLKNIDLHIKKGTVTGIVGPNACGKTTLMKCLLGLVLPDAGEIFIDGEGVDSKGNFRKKIGYMPQMPIFPSHLHPQEVLTMIEDLRGEQAPHRQELVDYFSLTKALRTPFEQLSGGTRQKIAVVIAFMFDAPIIILDEPTVGLDPIASVLFKDLVLKKTSSGASIILISHILSEVEQMTREMAFINDGCLMFSGTISSLLEKTKTSQIERAVIKLFENKEADL